MSLQDHDIDRQINELLASNRTASVATVDEQGQPHAACVQYVHDQRGRLYFISDPDSAHGLHIARTGQIALTIYAHEDRSPDQIHGLQLHGKCQLLTDPADRQHASDIFCRKYPFVIESDQLRQMVETQQFYRVTVQWTRWIDNRRQFGFNVERRH